MQSGGSILGPKLPKQSLQASGDRRRHGAVNHHIAGTAPLQPSRLLQDRESISMLATHLVLNSELGISVAVDEDDKFGTTRQVRTDWLVDQKPFKNCL